MLTTPLGCPGRRLRTVRARRKGDAFVATTTLQTDEQAATEDAPARSGLIEALLDNLPAWTVIAAGIAFLYLVWATVEILSRYVGPIPKVGP